MPELPDVEVYRKYLDATSLHKGIEKVAVLDGYMLKGISPGRFRARLTGRRLVSTARHGKYLFLRLEGEGFLVLHFGMTGRLKYAKHLRDLPTHVRLRLDFSEGFYLAFDCQRKLGMITITDDLEGFVREKGLGPDALGPGLDYRAFKEVLKGRRGAAKAALMDQKTIAGIGNIYADEILFHAGVHPLKSIGSFDEKALRALFKAMKRELKGAVDCRADAERFPRSCLLPHRLRGGRCPRCGVSLETVKVAGRTAYYCPKHQRL
jgi:formamidopyrimidine-DNA glycosylase